MEDKSEKFLAEITSKDYYDCLNNLLPLDEDEFEEFSYTKTTETAFINQKNKSVSTSESLWEDCWANCTPDEFLHNLKVELARK